MVIQEILGDTGALILQVTRIDFVSGMTTNPRVSKNPGHSFYRMHELVAIPFQIKFLKIEKKIGMLKGIYFQQQTDVFNKVSDSFESPKHEGQWVNLPTSPPIYQIHSPSTTTWFSKPVVILDLAQWRLFPQDSQSTVLVFLALVPSGHSLTPWYLWVSPWTASPTWSIHIWYKGWKYVIEMSLIWKEKIQLGVYMGWTRANRDNIDVRGTAGGWRKNINFSWSRLVKLGAPCRKQKTVEPSFYSDIMMLIWISSTGQDN